VRITREDWARLHPSDVAWVTEWQLATAFPWVPIGEESPVSASPEAEREERCWPVRVRAGYGTAHARLPLRDLARVIHWCHRVNRKGLGRPPAPIRASLQSLREALRQGLAHLDPLDRMGYTPCHSPEREAGA